ncbi:multidrug resistance efflux transporter family protein [Brevibacillus humidisoli]|uniref:DMT family transporter n=1 Tax=Brevibacillus humidisoli TaxID=2895522 RepID=UPI001E359357|nr:multidrug resistance efflux transporter family protein [Brevibacillus humidisoli]UFJ40939.1 multidrug resistance efflux transporter family protein [Brevibacillus humidisoli]
MKAIALGILSCLFFSTTFLLNRSMSLEGGSFAWSASLRFFFMIPPLLLIVWLSGGMKKLWKEWTAHPWTWILWGTVGFGVFYTATCFAADYGPGWLVAGTWQITIICGPLLAPLFGSKIPWKNLSWSILILIGVVIIQLDHAQAVTPLAVALTVLPLLAAAVAYPLGNRKMMEHLGGSLDTFSRILGMCLGSLPCWLLLAAGGYATHGWPSQSQVTQSLLVAVCSGLIATVLFFAATEMAGGDQNKLAAVEATQSTEIVFTLIGEMLLLGAVLPSFAALIGISIVCLGIFMQSMQRQKPTAHVDTA